jgi:hypothetical protein
MICTHLFAEQLSSPYYSLVHSCLSMPRGHEVLPKKDRNEHAPPLNRWHIRLSKSSIEEVVWKNTINKSEPDIKWTFEEDHMLALEEAGISSENILKTKRRRVTQTDYVSLNAQMDEEEKMQKSKFLELKGRSDALADIKRKRQRDEAAAARKVAAATKPASPDKPRVEKKKMSIEDIQAIKSKLDVKEPLTPTTVPSTYIQPLLKQLSTTFIDVDILKKTIIAKSLNPYRKHPDADVSAAAKALFKEWKAIFKRSKA